MGYHVINNLKKYDKMTKEMRSPLAKRTEASPV